MAGWLILLAVFITDASYTLMWRVLTRQSFTQPHNLHLYQRLARRWGGHRRVLAIVIAVNMLWLFPLATVSALQPQWALLLLLLAYAPLVVCMAKMGKLP